MSVSKMQKEKNLRTVLEWCRDCCFEPVKIEEETCYRSRENTPRELDCLQCLYEAVMEHKISKPRNWRKNQVKLESFSKKPIIRVCNDTNAPLVVRLNLLHTLPSVVNVQPQKEVAFFMRSNQIFFKVWPNNVVMFMDLEEKTSE